MEHAGVVVIATDGHMLELKVLGFIPSTNSVFVTFFYQKQVELPVKSGVHFLLFAENRWERIFAVNIDEKPLTWFTLASIRQENVKKI